MSVRPLCRALAVPALPIQWGAWECRAVSDKDWFATRGPGSCEDVLLRSRSGRRNPYQWLARAVSTSSALVLDVASGAGAMARELHRPNRVVISLDLDEDELRRARGRMPGPVVCADATRLPFGDASFDAVTTSMGLAMVRPLPTLLAEVARVLKPGGIFAAIVPTIRPMSPSDLARNAQLALQLRTPPRLPGELEFTIAAQLGAAGLTKVEDGRERYRFPVRSRADADLLINGLYLPTDSAARREAAADYLGRQVLARGVVEIAVPIRRIIAIK